MNSLKHKKYGSGEIRTRDLCVPNAESYQARPRSQQTKTIAQFKTIDRIPSCQEITIIKSEIHNLIVFVFYYLIFTMSEKDSEHLRKDLVKIEVKLIKSEIRFLKFMLKNARYQQNSMLKEIIR